MFVENTKSMLYLFFIFPFLIFLSLLSGASIKSVGWFGVAGFLLVTSTLIVGFLVYSKLPNLKGGKFLLFGASQIPDSRKWAYKTSFHLLVFFYLVSMVLISSFGS